MIANRAEDLPSYDRPPVHEVAIGIGFKRLGVWTATSAGEFYQLVKARFPNVEEKPPLMPLPSSAQETIELGITDLPPLRRVWYVSEDGALLIQVQSDRLHVNWRRTTEDAEYPRYRPVLEAFGYALEQFMQFAGHRGSQVEVVAGEVTYVNHIPEGELWSEWADLSGVFRDWAVVPQRTLGVKAVASVVTYDGGSEGTAFVSAGNQMNIEVKSALRTTDKARVLTLQLVNRGALHSSDIATISAWVGTASSDIVRAFTTVTADSAHKHWGRVR